MTASASVHWFILARCRGSFSPSVFLTVTSKLSSASHYCAALSVFCICFLVFIVFFLCVSADLLPIRKSLLSSETLDSHMLYQPVSPLWLHTRLRNKDPWTNLQYSKCLLSRCSEPLLKALWGQTSKSWWCYMITAQSFVTSLAMAPQWHVFPPITVLTWCWCDTKCVFIYFL